ncbi:MULTISPECIES: tyrosine recombinase [Bacillaceae]|uniref:Tyrosine recombinase XerC n=1 Tax=Evansella alkalicola TaxID=745819 RepID=A0ABS6JP15_9BACI|nr:MULTISPECIES: tyrosine recombinase [Bacillaceae]MBU9720309.1 tyrosine recombinase [Bacillus alkalicola]
MNQEWVKQFIQYLQIEKGVSVHTIKNYQRDINDFYYFFESRTTNVEHTYTEVREYLNDLIYRAYSRKSIARRVSALRSFYKYLLKEGAVSQNPFNMIAVSNSRKGSPPVFAEKEINSLFDSIDTTEALGKRNLALIELLYATGIRVSECVDLNISDYDKDIGTIHVNGKGRRERYVPVGSLAMEALENYLTNGRPKILQRISSEKALFLNYRGGRITDRGVRVVLSKLMENTSNIMKISPDVIRHTFATHMLNEGADFRTVQELLGHSTSSSTQRYAHGTKDRLTEVYRSSHPRA